MQFQVCNWRIVVGGCRCTLLFEGSCDQFARRRNEFKHLLALKSGRTLCHSCVLLHLTRDLLHDARSVAVTRVCVDRQASYRECCRGHRMFSERRVGNEHCEGAPCRG